MESLTSVAAIMLQFGPAPLMQLRNMWNKVDPRYLTLHLISATGIPALDESGTSDAYCVAYLVPPEPPR
jgi:Ca2+-dependent lipid-binding protein